MRRCINQIPTEFVASISCGLRCDDRLIYLNKTRVRFLIQLKFLASHGCLSGPKTATKTSWTKVLLFSLLNFSSHTAYRFSSILECILVNAKTHAIPIIKIILNRWNVIWLSQSGQISSLPNSKFRISTARPTFCCWNLLFTPICHRQMFANNFPIYQFIKWKRTRALNFSQRIFFPRYFPFGFIVSESRSFT